VHNFALAYFSFGIADCAHPSTNALLQANSPVPIDNIDHLIEQESVKELSSNFLSKGVIFCLGVSWNWVMGKLLGKERSNLP